MSANFHPLQSHAASQVSHLAWCWPHPSPCSPWTQLSWSHLINPTDTCKTWSKQMTSSSHQTLLGVVLCTRWRCSCPPRHSRPLSSRFCLLFQQEPLVSTMVISLSIMQWCFSSSDWSKQPFTAWPWSLHYQHLPDLSRTSSIHLSNGETVIWKSVPQKATNTQTHYPRYLMMIAALKQTVLLVGILPTPSVARTWRTGGTDQFIHGNETHLYDVCHGSLSFLSLGQAYTPHIHSSHGKLAQLSSWQGKCSSCPG